MIENISINRPISLSSFETYSLYVYIILIRGKQQIWDSVVMHPVQMKYNKMYLCSHKTFFVHTTYLRL
jgi:hypothetical protein